MKYAARLLLNILKWIVILLIILFSIATLMGKSYLQTSLLWLLVLILAWWPPVIATRWNKTLSLVARLAMVIILLVVCFAGFKPDPKSSIYLSDQLESELLEIYDRKVRYWPAGTEDILPAG